LSGFVEHVTDMSGFFHRRSSACCTLSRR